MNLKMMSRKVAERKKKHKLVTLCLRSKCQLEKALAALATKRSCSNFGYRLCFVNLE